MMFSRASRLAMATVDLSTGVVGYDDTVTTDFDGFLSVGDGLDAFD